MIRPDEAMGQLYPSPPASVSQAGSGAELDVMARLALVVGQLGDSARRLAEARERDQAAWASCHPVPIVPNVTNGAGLIDDADRWGPRPGWAWRVTRLTLAMAAGGTATVYRNTVAQGNELLYNVPPGVWEPERLILLPGQRLAVSASMQAVVSGDAEEINLAVLPAYLMRGAR